MPLSTESKLAIAEGLKYDFFQFIHANYDVELSELLADASLDFINQTFSGKMDVELETELATSLIKDAYIAL